MSKLNFGLLAIAASFMGYAVYFDYQRHNNKEFRQKIAKAERDYAKQKEDSNVKQTQVKLIKLKQQLLLSLQKDPLPTSVKDKETYFMEQVAKGEQAASIPGKEIDSAILFYKALCVYPFPTDILNVFEKNLPGTIFELIVSLIAVQPPTGLADVLGLVAASSENLD